MEDIKYYLAEFWTLAKFVHLQYTFYALLIQHCQVSGEEIGAGRTFTVDADCVRCGFS